MVYYRLVLSAVLAVMLCLPAWAQSWGDDRATVLQTPLSREGRSLQPGLCAPVEGLVSNAADITRTTSQAKILNNLQAHKRRGVWSSRDIGWVEERESAFNGGAAFLDFGTFIDATGVETLLFQVGSKVYSYNFSTHTETEILSDLSATKLPCMRGYSPSIASSQPIVVYCNGDSEPQKITSVSTATDLEFNGGAWPGTFVSKTYGKPAICENFADRMAYAKFDESDTAFDILISDQGNAETFTISTPLVATDAVSFTVPSVLGGIVGMHSYKVSSAEVLIVGCTKGIAVIEGDNATNFSLRILNRSHGLASNRTWVEVDNDILFLASDGVRSFSQTALGSNLASNTLSQTILDQFRNVDYANAYKAHATHNPTTQEIQFWVPYTFDSGNCLHALIANYNTDAGIARPAWSTKSGTGLGASIFFEKKFWGGGLDGKLQEHYKGDTYNGTPIPFDYVSPLISLGNPTQKQGLRKISVITDGGNQSFEVKGFLYVRLTNGITQRVSAEPASMHLQAIYPGGTVLGQWVLGTSGFPSDFVKTLDYSASGSAIFWEFEISSSGSADAIDLVGFEYILSGGGIVR